MPKVKFAYQHPKFGRSAADKLKEPFKKSVYYYWWEFLRLNTEYRECCSRGGKGKLEVLYKDFGDVFSVDFKTWWQSNERGASLFAEKLPPSFSVVPSKNIEEQDGVLYLRVPLSLPKRFLTREFQKILDKHHDGARGKRHNALSTAKYPVSGHVDIKSLCKCLIVYQERLANPKEPMWQIAMKFPSIYEGIVRKTRSGENILDAQVKNVLANSVKRLLNRAEKIIAGTSLGKFPTVS